MTKACRANWKYINGYVWRRMRIYSDVGIWTLIEDNKLAENLISNIIDQGWAVVEKPLKSDGFHLRSIKRIIINDKLGYYDRDITLFHELVHIFYGDKVKDEIVVEWIARKIRAHPQILRQAIRKF